MTKLFADGAPVEVGGKPAIGVDLSADSQPVCAVPCSYLEAIREYLLDSPRRDDVASVLLERTKALLGEAT